MVDICENESLNFSIGCMFWTTVSVLIIILTKNN